MHNSKNVFIAIYINLLFTSLLRGLGGGGGSTACWAPKFQLWGGAWALPESAPDYM